VHWDISWHRSIGRDSFWTPAHMRSIYQECSPHRQRYLILSPPSTEARRCASRRDDWDSGDRWALSPPGADCDADLGALRRLVALAYGLDVKIISPPHALLFLGNGAIQMARVILILGQMNRAKESCAQS